MKMQASWTFLLVQWLRLRVSMAEVGTGQSLVREVPYTTHGVAKKKKKFKPLIRKIRNCAIIDINNTVPFPFF